MSRDTAVIWMDIGGFINSSQFKSFDRNELLNVMVSTGIELDSLKAGQSLVGELMYMATNPQDFQSWSIHELFEEIGNFSVTISSIIRMLEELNQGVSSTHRDKYPPERAF